MGLEVLDYMRPLASILGLGGHDPLDFGMGVRVLHEILLYPIMYRNMRREPFPK